MRKEKRYWQVALLASLVVFHGVNNWFWLRANEIPISSDRIRHFLNSVTYPSLERCEH